MTKYVTEILSEINNDATKIANYKDNFTIKTIFQYSYNPELKFLLPPGEPPYVKDAAPIGMSPANFYQQVRKLYVFTRTDISPVRREQLFIQMLEGLHPSEADVLIAIKDQALDKKYASLTRKLGESVGWLEPTVEEVKQDSKSEGKSLVLNLNDSATTKESFSKPKEKVVRGDDAPVKRGRGRPRKNPVA